MSSQPGAGANNPGIYLAHETGDGGWPKIAFFGSPFGTCGMMFPRQVTVGRAGAKNVETVLEQCTAFAWRSGVSGNAFAGIPRILRRKACRH